MPEGDVEGAQHWYAEKDPKLAAAFARDFTRTVDRIATMPDQFPEVGRNVRRALLHQFPYACYFLRRADHAVVIAVLHQCDGLAVGEIAQAENSASMVAPVLNDFLQLLGTRGISYAIPQEGGAVALELSLR